MRVSEHTHKIVQTAARHNVHKVFIDTNEEAIIDYLHHDNIKAIQQHGGKAEDPDMVLPITTAPGSTARDTCGDGISEYVLQGHKWNKTKLPITYFIDTTKAPSIDKTAAVAAIDAAFTTYNDQFRGPFFKKVLSAAEAKITVEWGFIDGSLNQAGYCAYSWGSDGYLRNASIVLDSGDKWYVSTTERCGFWGDKLDIQNIVTHEIGHAVGLSHSPNDPQATMYATSKTGETLRRTLGLGDSRGFFDLYGAVPVWPDELDYGPVVINGQYNQPVQTVQIEGVGPVTYRKAFLDQVAAIGWGRTRNRSWYLGCKANAGTDPVTVKWLATNVFPLVAP
jgi:hypothetical protein